MTITSLIKDIKKNKIQVNFGRAWLDHKNPMKYLLENLNYAKNEAFNTASFLSQRNTEDSEEYKKFQAERTKEGPDTITVCDGRLYYGILSSLKLNSSITNKDYYLILNENKIEFKGFDNKVNGYNKPLIYPNVPDDIETPMVTSIDVPTKELIFANRFSKEISPDMINPHASENCLNGLVGRRNIQKHLANNGVLFGQLTNTSYIIWVKDDNKEIIITEAWVEEDEDRKEVKKLFKFFKENCFKQIGKSICCTTWRWEATDSSKVPDFDKTNVKIKIDGTKATLTHYYDSITPSEISKLVCSHVIISN